MTRNKVLRIIVILTVAVITARLFQIQVIEHDEWVAKAEAQQTMQYTLKAERGEIYMMDGTEPSAVVMNETVYTVIIDPQITNEEKAREQLTEILGDRRIAEWNDVFANKTLRYYVIARNVERSVAEQVADADLAGVWLQGTTKRVYPEGELGAAVLGFVNAEGEGQYGVEGSLNDRLSGEDGMLKTIKDINNVALSIGDDNIKIPAQDGENIVLTIDKNIQYNVERILEEQSNSLGMAYLSALVMDPNTGKVLAMANYPGYDPANYGQVESAEIYVNHTVDDAYQPASVCKPFTIAAGLEYGVLTADKTYENTGETTVEGWPIRNVARSSALNGSISMQTVLDYSLNTGTVQALRWLSGSETDITSLGRERLYEYYHDRFGLGDYTGIELYESPGSVIEPNANVYGLNSTYANMTFGQGMYTSMVQVASAFSALINGGNYYTPTVIAGTIDESGLFTRNADAALVRTGVVSQRTSEIMREMLYNTRLGSRTRGEDRAGYYVGGKTGTAQTIKDGEYTSDETIASYVGFGGATGEDSEYVIMVRVWEENKNAGGETHALPVFTAISNYVQDYLRIKPGE